MIFLPRKTWRLAPLCLLLLAALLISAILAACDTAKPDDKTYSLVTVFPASGADAAVGQAMQRAVDLAVKQNAALGKGYTLTVTHVDEASVSDAGSAAQVVANAHVLGVVGPFRSDTAVTLLPTVAQSGVVTISPTATLPGLTQATAAAAEGLDFAKLHPKGKAVAFFRMAPADTVLGRAAADLAVAPAAAHGLAAQSLFVVDDGTPSGKAESAAFIQELKAQHGAVAGQQSLTSDATSGQSNAQSIVSSIVEANPNAVFFAGDIASGAKLRSTLSLTGAPQLPILAVGAIANDPSWAATVGVVPAAAYTTAILPAPDLSALKDASAKTFASAYAAAYPDNDLLPQSALAYDAAMDEITAIKSLVTAGKPLTRAAVLGAVASAKYPGVTGTLAFDANGDRTPALGLAVYTCDIKGAWKYQTGLSGH